MRFEAQLQYLVMLIKPPPHLGRLPCLRHVVKLCLRCRCPDRLLGHHRDSVVHDFPQHSPPHRDLQGKGSRRLQIDGFISGSDVNTKQGAFEVAREIIRRNWIICFSRVVKNKIVHENTNTLNSKRGAKREIGLPADKFGMNSIKLTLTDVFKQKKSC